MTVSEYIAEVLAEKEVPAVFELVGGMITLLLDAIYLHGKTPIVSMHHEQGAAFAAEGLARMKGVPCVAMATSGPGATNLLTGIGSCYFDSIPAVFITGQVNTFERKGESDVRQMGFQETDIYRMVQPIVKQAWYVEDANQIPQIMEEAFRIAVEGRPGPVLIDIPMNIQKTTIHPDSFLFQRVKSDSIEGISESQAREIAHALLQAKQPVILAGAGVRISGAIEYLRSIAERASIPVLHTLMAVDVLPSNHPLNAGMIGSYGNRWSNLALSDADFVLVLGSRLDVRQTGSDIQGFSENRSVYHIDCDQAEMNNRIRGCHVFHDDLHHALPLIAEALYSILMDDSHDLDKWQKAIGKMREEWPDDREIIGVDGINPNCLMHAISQGRENVSAYIVDVGQHQMWAAQSLEICIGQRFLTSGGMGAMGFALPAAIGASLACPERPVVMIAGDGSFQCNIQEMHTVMRMQLPIKMVIINNQSLGMVRQFQQSYFESRFQSTVWGYSAPDFSSVSSGYGIRSRTISLPEEVGDAIAWLYEQDDKPALLQVMISPSANAYPKLAYGKGMRAMEPHVQPEGMEAT